MNTDLTIDGCVLRLNGRPIELGLPVKDAFQRDESSIILLYDPDAPNERLGQFRNLVAIDSSGDELWIAELPTNQSADVYTAIASKEPLEAFSWTSFRCRLDATTGRLLSKEFLK